MRHHYGPYDGTPFPAPDSLFPEPKVVQFILQYGQKALEAMENLERQEERDYIQTMIDAGLLERDPATGKLRITPRMLRGIEHKALLDIFQNLSRGPREGHPTPAPGRGDERSDGTKPYEFGDPISELDLSATLRNALHRLRQASPERMPRLPLQLLPGDFELHLSEGQGDVALCILLDMSGSMMRYGRFYHAKRVALGMAALMRARFPLDTVDYVGFYSLAGAIPERDLPLVGPKPISMHEHQVRLRIPLAQAQARPQGIPQHFTNLQLGLRTARQVLARRAAANKQVFIITDGQPTAHVEPAGEDGRQDEMLYLLYPPSERTATMTLKEGLRCMQQGIRIATFALVEDYWGMEWVGFVDQLTRLTRGMAYYCAGDDLSHLVIESYLNGKRRKTFVA